MAAYANPSPFEIDSLKGKKAPMFDLPSIEGQNIGISSFAGMPLILFFCASWSPLSKTELLNLHKAFQKTNLTIIAVSTDRSIEEARSFAKRLQGKGIHFAFDAGGRAAKDLFKVFVMPTAFYIDERGIIDRVYLGAQHWDIEKERLNE